MADMPTSPAHARPLPRNHDRAAAWLVLVGAGATTMSFNIWHAVHAGMPALLAPLEGVAPVVVAMGLSHVVSAYRGGWFMKTATFGIMLAAMVLSLDATGKVVGPALGPLWWLFGLTVDAAALVALQVILSPESRAAASAARKTAKTSPDAVLETALESAPESIAGTVPESSDVPPEVPAEMPVSVPSRSRAQVPRAVSEEPDAKRARAAYRASVANGKPLSEAALGAKYGKSRTWGRNRINEVKEGPALASAAGASS